MKKFEGLIFAIDFDGTCVMHCFPKVGVDCPEAVRTLNWIVDNGGKIILNTMRSDDIEKGTRYLSEAVSWFHNKRIPLTGINKNPEQDTWTSSPKVYANVYIDDAALGCPLSFEPELCDRPFVNWPAVKELLGYYSIPTVKIHEKTTITEIN